MSLLTVDQRAFKSDVHALIDRCGSEESHTREWMHSEVEGIVREHGIQIKAGEFAKHVTMLTAANNAQRAHKLVNALSDKALSKMALAMVLFLWVAIRLALLALFVVLVVMAYQWVTS